MHLTAAMAARMTVSSSSPIKLSCGSSRSCTFDKHAGNNSCNALFQDNHAPNKHQQVPTLILASLLMGLTTLTSLANCMCMIIRFSSVTGVDYDVIRCCLQLVKRCMLWSNMSGRWCMPLRPPYFRLRTFSQITHT